MLQIIIDKTGIRLKEPLCDDSLRGDEGSFDVSVEINTKVTKPMAIVASEIGEALNVLLSEKRIIECVLGGTQSLDGDNDLRHLEFRAVWRLRQ